MPNNLQSVVDPEALDRKILLVTDRIYTDVGFNFGGTRESSEHFGAIKDKAIGLKVYLNPTTGSLFLEDYEEIEAVFSRWNNPQPIMVHAEDEKLDIALSLAEKHGRTLHVCHVSDARSAERIFDAKNEGLDVTAEVAMHHLFLTESDRDERLRGFGTMKPPLKTGRDIDALWKHIKLGTIDMIASDHAPHTKAEKELDNPPFGVPGLESTIPLLLTAVADGRLSIDDVIKLTSKAPRERFGIPMFENTFAVVDLEQQWQIRNEDLFTKSGWSPFDGTRVTGKVTKVVLRGKTVFDNGDIQGDPSGQVLYSTKI